MQTKKILVADDDTSILEAVKLMLEEFDYDVITTTDDTINLVNKEKPDLILLDIRMSGTDGRDICKYLKSTPGTKNIPVIMLSANINTKSIALEVGADDSIVKPFQMDKLISTVRKYTKN